MKTGVVKIPARQKFTLQVFRVARRVEKVINKGRSLCWRCSRREELVFSEEFLMNSAKYNHPETSIREPISITSVLSKVFERLVSDRLGRFMERSGVLPTTQFAYRKGLGTCGL